MAVGPVRWHEPSLGFTPSGPPPWSSSAIRPGASVTLADDRVRVSVGTAAFAVLRSALDEVRAQQPDQVDHLLQALHTAEQGSTIALGPGDGATLRSALRTQRPASLGLLRLLLLR